MPPHSPPLLICYIASGNFMASKVSIGLPVRNGERFIGRAIESVLAQDFSDFELVICDNVSDDGTIEIVRGYATRDSRVKLFENERDIGQIANMNRIFEVAKGEYFRWAGDDDWFEPDYLSKSVAFLDEHPDFIAVSTYIKYSDDDGHEFYAEYTGERMESPDPVRRFVRMLWLLQADYRFADTHYAMYRSSALKQTRLLPVAFATDMLLAAELSLIGRFGHVPECLSYRRRVPEYYDEKEMLRALYNPEQPEELRPSTRRLCANYNALVSAAPLTAAQKATCRVAIARFFGVAELRALDGRARKFARRLPGYHRVKTVLGR